MIENKHNNIVRIIHSRKIVYEKQPEEKYVIKNINYIGEIIKEKDQYSENIARSFLLSHGRNKKRYCQGNTVAFVDRLIKMRMEGENLKVLTIAGSGNQGIFLRLPFYELYQKKEMNVIPAMLFSILTQIYITQKKGRISGVCGLVNKAAPALVAGVAYQQDKSIEDITKRMKSIKKILKPMNYTGAKKSCSLKASLIMDKVYKFMEL